MNQNSDPDGLTEILEISITRRLMQHRARRGHCYGMGKAAVKSSLCLLILIHSFAAKTPNLLFIYL